MMYYFVHSMILSFHKLQQKEVWRGFHLEKSSSLVTITGKVRIKIVLAKLANFMQKSWKIEIDLEQHIIWNLVIATKAWQTTKILLQQHNKQKHLIVQRHW
jgi:hypothetical protein